MKFAIAAVLATTSAIRINKAKDCVSQELSEGVFKMMDWNHTGSVKLTYVEDNLQWVNATQENHYAQLSKPDMKWIDEAGKKLYLKPGGKIGEREYFKFSNAVFEKLDLCHVAHKQAVQMVQAECNMFDGEKVYKIIQDEEAKAKRDKKPITVVEIKKAMDKLAKSIGHKITDAEWKKWEEEAKKMEKKYKLKTHLAEFEWGQFAQEFFKKIGVCKAEKEFERHDKELMREHECISHRQAHRGFDHLDTNHNGSLSLHEIKKGIEYMVHHQHHHVSKKEWEWVEAGVKSISHKTDKVDKEEFWKFANDVFRHFDMCHLARDESNLHREEKRLHLEEEAVRREEKHAHELRKWEDRDEKLIKEVLHHEEGAVHWVEEHLAHNKKRLAHNKKDLEHAKKRLANIEKREGAIEDQK